MSELTVIGVLAACAAYGITVVLSRSASRLNGIDGRLLNHAVIAFIIILCIILTGPFGVVILILATALGLGTASGEYSQGFLHGRDHSAGYTLLFWSSMDLIS